MRRRILTLLVISIGVSCIGLISLQYQWIRQDIDTEKAKFSMSVSHSMNKVVSELEQIELMKYFNNLKQQPAVIESFNSLNQQISNIYKNNSTQQKTSDLSSHAWLSLLSTDDTLSLGKFLSARERQDEMRETNELISRLLENTLENISYFPFEINIYIPLMDSLIAHSLARNGISTKYTFGIYNTFSELFTYINQPEDSVNLSLSSYRYALFPDDQENPENFLVIAFPNEKSFIFSRISYFLWTSIIFICVIFVSFAFSLSIIFKQRKLSEIKNDFINNMTHEIKTPIATISLASEALSDESFEQDKEIQKTYINIIKDENKRLEMLVVRILEQAKQGSINQSIKKENIDIHQVIEECVRNMELIASQRGGEIQQKLQSKNPIVIGDKMHLSNIILNLIDNAIKYSPQKPNVQISTTDSMTGVEIRIKDKGVGISKKDHKRIFDRFYRVPTGDDHDVRGYGVGLSYVRYAIQAHGGSIRVESELKKGATFIIFLPNRKA